MLENATVTQVGPGPLKVSIKTCLEKITCTTAKISRLDSYSCLQIARSITSSNTRPITLFVTVLRSINTGVNAFYTTSL